MKVAVYLSDEGTGHITPPGHPEQVARLSAVRRGLTGLVVDIRATPQGDMADVLRCHPEQYVSQLQQAVPEKGWVRVDGDTFLSPGSFVAAMHGVGGICAAVDAVVSNHVSRAFVAARPPGHHAETRQAMGFCLFGNIAIAAKRALNHHGLSRVAIVDFDVHHGNGTQALLWDETRCLFISSHQMPLYPGSGHTHECGAHGQILNIPLQDGTGGTEMRAVYESRVFPALAAWQPELLLISAGFDAHRADPLAGLMWEAQDFYWLTQQLCQFAGGRVVSTLEGGYDLDVLAECVAAHVVALMETDE